ncbi:MAG: glycosyltransferase family 2 protein [Rhodospirillales bacterium]
MGETQKPTLLIPKDDVADPEVSVVIPALDEEPVIGSFVDWCREGMEKAGAAAEILIIDSSADRTGEIALAKGARVLKVPRRGLGRAYIDAIPFIRGKYLILGDADCTYDFREIGPFIERFREGYEFVMGSRFAGSIEPGAMPPLHRYFGTPLTNFILNFIYGTGFSDIHCGMRGITLAALKEMNLSSQSWDYASEMIVKSLRLNLKTVEVPVRFYKDREGRLSHHKRAGWFSSWYAGWINLRTMLIHGADFFVMKPGLALLALGLLVTLPLIPGPVTIGGITFSLNAMLLGSTLSIVGLQCFFLGCIAQSLYDYSGQANRRWRSRFAYTPTMAVVGVMFVAGLGLAYNFADAYVGAGFIVTEDIIAVNHLAVAGLLAIVISFLTFVSTLILHAIGLYRPTSGGHDVDG